MQLRAKFLPWNADARGEGRGEETEKQGERQQQQYAMHAGTGTGLGTGTGTGPQLEPDAFVHGAKRTFILEELIDESAHERIQEERARLAGCIVACNKLHDVSAAIAGKIK